MDWWDGLIQVFFVFYHWALIVLIYYFSKMIVADTIDDEKPSLKMQKAIRYILCVVVAFWIAIGGRNWYNPIATFLIITIPSLSGLYVGLKKQKL